MGNQGSRVKERKTVKKEISYEEVNSNIDNCSNSTINIDLVSKTARGNEILITTEHDSTHRNLLRRYHATIQVSSFEELIKELEAAIYNTNIFWKVKESRKGVKKYFSIQFQVINKSILIKDLQTLNQSPPCRYELSIGSDLSSSNIYELLKTLPYGSNHLTFVNNQVKVLDKLLQTEKHFTSLRFKCYSRGKLPLFHHLKALVEVEIEVSFYQERDQFFLHHQIGFLRYLKELKVTNSGGLYYFNSRDQVWFRCIVTSKTILEPFVKLFCQKVVHGNKELRFEYKDCLMISKQKQIAFMNSLRKSTGLKNFEMPTNMFQNLFKASEVL